VKGPVGPAVHVPRQVPAHPKAPVENPVAEVPEAVQEKKETVTKTVHARDEEKPNVPKPVKMIFEKVRRRSFPGAPSYTDDRPHPWSLHVVNLEKLDTRVIENWWTHTYDFNYFCNFSE
jgi:hypothetical protein